MNVCERDLHLKKISTLNLFYSIVIRPALNILRFLFRLMNVAIVTQRKHCYSNNKENMKKQQHIDSPFPLSRKDSCFYHLRVFFWFNLPFKSFFYSFYRLRVKKYCYAVYRGGNGRSQTNAAVKLPYFTSAFGSKFFFLLLSFIS